MDKLKIMEDVNSILDGYLEDIKNNYFSGDDENTLISANIPIDFDNIPDNIKYSKVENYLRDKKVEITHRMFTSYIQQGILPPSNKINDKMALYSKDHILLYFLVSDIKKYINLDRIKGYIDTLKPEIELYGVEEIVKRYYETEKEIHDEIFKMIKQLLIPVMESVTNSISSEFQEEELTNEDKNAVDKLKKYIGMSSISNLILIMGKAMIDMFDELMNSYKPGMKDRNEIDEFINRYRGEELNKNEKDE